MKAVDRNAELVRPEQAKANLISGLIGIAAGVGAYLLARKFFALKAELAGPPPDISISSGSIDMWNVDEDTGGAGRVFHTHWNYGTFSQWEIDYWPESSGDPQLFYLDFGDDGVLTTKSGYELRLTTQQDNSASQPKVRLKVQAKFKFSPVSGPGHWRSADEKLASFNFPPEPPSNTGDYPLFKFYAVP